MEIVADWLANDGRTGTAFWLFAKDVITDPLYVNNVLMWLHDSTDLPVDAPMWLPGEPNGGNGDCVMLDIISVDTYGLKMETCFNEHYILCKI